MFERFISSILTRLLGEYVEGSTFNAESVKLGIWRGGELMVFATAVLVYVFRAPGDYSSRYICTWGSQTKKRMGSAY